MTLLETHGAPAAEATPETGARTEVLTPLPNGSPASPTRDHDISDHELGHIIAIGAVAGSLLIFLLVAGLCLAAGAGLGQAAGIAALPAFFGGWFYGGTALMLSAADRARAVHTPHVREAEAPAR